MSLVWNCKENLKMKYLVKLFLPIFTSVTWFAVAADISSATDTPQRADSQHFGVPDPAYAHSQYMLHCQGCHLPDGTGFAGRIPNLVDFVGYFLTIDGGREFLVQVPGSSSAPMDDETLAQVLNWMLMTYSKKQLPKDYQPYSAEEVAKLRQHPRVEVEQYRAKLLEQLTQK